MQRYLKRDGVCLNQELINFARDFLDKRGYTPLQTLFFLRKDVMAKCAQLDRFDGELYKIESYKCDAADSSTPADIPRDGSSIESRDVSIQSYIQGVQATRQELGHSDSASVEGTAEFMSNQENVNHCSHGEFCLLCLATGSSALASLLENTHALISPNTGSGERTADVVNPRK